MQLIEEAKAYVGMKVNGVSVNLDLVNYCCLRCPSCSVGSIGGRQASKMDLPTFIRILDKFRDEGVKIRHIQAYVYSDPFLHPNLDLFVKECTDRGIDTWLSTMLQTTKADFAKVIEARPTEFRVSMPGLTHMRYYQKGADPNVFIKNFVDVCKLPRHKETKWTFVYHLYKDNGGKDLEVARAMAEANGFKFVVLSAIFMPLEKMVEESYTEQDEELISHLLHTPEEAASLMKRTDYCPLWKHITLDAEANVFLCELIYEQRFKMGSLFSRSIHEWLDAIKSDPFCGKCIAKKANTYQLCYSEIAKSKDPVGDANRKRMV
jgi:hypothetical protein